MMEIFCIGVFSLELLAIFYLLIGKSRIPKSQDGDQIAAISFVIPFHNEQDRILPLIQVTIRVNASLFLWMIIQRMIRFKFSKTK